MTDLLIIIWLVIFFVFLLGSIAANSRWLGGISGIWLLLFALFIVVTGVQVSSGMNISYGTTTDTISYSYTDALLPETTYAYVWGILLLLIGLYLFFNALLAV